MAIGGMEEFLEQATSRPDPDDMHILTPDVDPHALAKAKLKLAEGLDQGDNIGHDTNLDHFYKGKSLELGKGGRSLMLKDRITMDLVEKGYPLEEAKALAEKQTYAIGAKKYGARQMNAWAKAGSK